MTALIYGLAAFGAFTLGCWVAFAAWFGAAWATEAYRGRRSRRVDEQENARAVREAERFAALEDLLDGPEATPAGHITLGELAEFWHGKARATSEDER